MQMTEADIVRSYKQAKKKQAQIKILADLNLCTKKEIRDILEKKGCDVPKYGNRYTTNSQPPKSSTPQIETPSIVIDLAKARMDAINDQMKPLENRLEELSKEYNILKGWVDLMEKCH